METTDTATKDTSVDKDTVSVRLETDWPDNTDNRATHEHDVPDMSQTGGSNEETDPIVIRLNRCHASCIGIVEVVQKHVHGSLGRNARHIKLAILILLLLGYIAYFCYAVYYSVSGALVIIVITSLVILVAFCRLVNRKCGLQIRSLVCIPTARIFHSRQCRYFRWLLYIGVFLGVILFVAIDVARDPMRLTSFFGLIIFILIAYVSSVNPSRVVWRPVIWGLALQFFLGIIILRWRSGFFFFKFLGDQVEVFLNYADEGSKLVFGDPEYLMHRMAFKVFPAVIYFSAVISILYYWGFMQFVVVKIAWMMQLTMGTTAIESLNAASNIFIGMAEGVVMLRPFIPKLTKSELHAVMTGGFATVSGSYIALLIEVGATAEHLLSAAIMSAPAALAIAKLNYPETERSCTKTEDDVHMEKTPARNLVEAASNGAVDAIKIVTSVAANMIAILGLIAFFNATLSYMGARVGYPEFSFQVLCSYVFWPLAAIMGVEIADAQKVASLLGTKVFVDEFISFRDLGDLVRQGAIADRSAVIATYACCGFGSVAAIGIYIGALVSISPARRGDISEVAFRAFVNGNVAGFMTACVAGILYTGQSLFDMGPAANATAIYDLMTNATALQAENITGFNF